MALGRPVGQEAPRLLAEGAPDRAAEERSGREPDVRSARCKEQAARLHPVGLFGVWRGQEVKAGAFGHRDRYILRREAPGLRIGQVP